jgi:hypothetical protein
MELELLGRLLLDEFDEPLLPEEELLLDEDGALPPNMPTRPGRTQSSPARITTLSAARSMLPF